MIPRGKAREVVEAADLIARREAVILDAAKAPGANVETIKEAMIQSAKVN